jgi:hypothetical protein
VPRREGKGGGSVKKTAYLKARVTSAFEREMKRYAKQRGWTMAQLIRAAMAWKLERREV